MKLIDYAGDQTLFEVSELRADSELLDQVRTCYPESDQTSRLATSRAWVWMKSRRGSTTSPMRVEKMSSA